MTKQVLNLSRCIPIGVTNVFRTPCASHHFSPEVIRETFQKKLPDYIQQLNVAFDRVPMGQLSGLAPTGQGGPFDDCVINGSWNADQQSLHGGPIPMLGGVPGSRGVPEQWPRNQKHTVQMGFSPFEAKMRMQTQWAPAGFANKDIQVDHFQWAGLSWSADSKEAETAKHFDKEGMTSGSQRFNSDGTPRKRGYKKGPNRKRGGVQRRRCNPKKKERDTYNLKIFFGNTTLASE